jgi:hypothetical protein
MVFIFKTLGFYDINMHLYPTFTLFDSIRREIYKVGKSFLVNQTISSLNFMFKRARESLNLADS